MTSPPEVENKRPIRSYVIRSGRLTGSQRKAIDQHWQDYVIDFQKDLLDFQKLFHKPGKLVIEIGFGMGDSLLEMAIANPGNNYIGIEVHRPGVGKLLHGIAENNVSNLKVICHDAKEVFEFCIVDGTVDRLQIYFPDPWPKKRHNKRRLVQTEFIVSLLPKLKPGAEIHMATDVQAYAEHMMEVLEGIEELTNSNGKQNYWKNANRPDTKFENRGKRLGHGVWDLLFSRVLARKSSD